MADRIQLRRGSPGEADAANPILAAGEPAVALAGQPVFKVGDGATPWSALPDLAAGPPWPPRRRAGLWYVTPGGGPTAGTLVSTRSYAYPYPIGRQAVAAVAMEITGEPGAPMSLRMGVAVNNDGQPGQLLAVAGTADTVGVGVHTRDLGGQFTDPSGIIWIVVSLDSGGAGGVPVKAWQFSQGYAGFVAPEAIGTLNSGAGWGNTVQLGAAGAVFPAAGFAPSLVATAVWAKVVDV